MNRAPSYDRTLVALRVSLLVPLLLATLVTGLLAVAALLVSYPAVYVTKHQLPPLQAIMKLHLRVYAQSLASATPTLAIVGVTAGHMVTQITGY